MGLNAVIEFLVLRILKLLRRLDIPEAAMDRLCRGHYFLKAICTASSYTILIPLLLQTGTPPVKLLPLARWVLTIQTVANCTERPFLRWSRSYKLAKSMLLN
jgi:hypothetical protein